MRAVGDFVGVAASSFSVPSSTLSGSVMSAVAPSSKWFALLDFVDDAGAGVGVVGVLVSWEFMVVEGRSVIIGRSTSALPPEEGVSVVGTAFSVGEGAAVEGFVVGTGDLEELSSTESGDRFVVRLLDGREELPFPLVLLDEDLLIFSFDGRFFDDDGFFFFRRFDFSCFERSFPDLPFDDDDLEMESLSELPFADDDRCDFELLPPFPFDDPPSFPFPFDDTPPFPLPLESFEIFALAFEDLLPLFLLSVLLLCSFDGRAFNDLLFFFGRLSRSSQYGRLLLLLPMLASDLLPLLAILSSLLSPMFG